MSNNKKKRGGKREGKNKTKTRAYIEWLFVNCILNEICEYIQKTMICAMLERMESIEKNEERRIFFFFLKKKQKEKKQKKKTC